MRWRGRLWIAILTLLIFSRLLPGTVSHHPSAAAKDYQRGLEHSKRGEDDQAVADFKKAIQLDPGRLEAYEALDDVFSRHGQWDAIIAYWTQFIKLQPDNATAYCERGAAYSHQHDLAHTLSDARKACSLGDQDCCHVVTRFTPAQASRQKARVPADYLTLSNLALSNLAQIAALALIVIVAAALIFALISILRARRRRLSEAGDKPIQRPLGVTVIAILSFLLAFFLLGIGVQALSGKDTEVVGLSVVFSVPFFALGFGLWTLRSWARVTTIFFTSWFLIALVRQNSWVISSPFPISLLPMSLLHLAIVALFIWIISYLSLPRGGRAFTSRVKPQLSPRNVSRPDAGWKIPPELEGPLPRQVRAKRMANLLARLTGGWAGLLAILWWGRKLFQTYLIEELAQHRLDYRGVELALVAAFLLGAVIVGTRKWVFVFVGLRKLLQAGTAARGEVTSVKQGTSGRTIRYRFSNSAGLLFKGKFYVRYAIGLHKDLKAGSFVTVLYHPKKPRTNALYLLNDYEIAP